MSVMAVAEGGSAFVALAVAALAKLSKNLSNFLYVAELAFVAA